MVEIKTTGQKQAIMMLALATEIDFAIGDGTGAHSDVKRVLEIVRPYIKEALAFASGEEINKATYKLLADGYDEVMRLASEDGEKTGNNFAFEWLENALADAEKQLHALKGEK